LKPKDVLIGAKALYSSSTMEIKGKEKEKEALLSKPITTLLDLDKDDEYVDLVVVFTLLEGGELLKDTPIVRIHFKWTSNNSKKHEKWKKKILMELHS